MGFNNKSLISLGLIEEGNGRVLFTGFFFYRRVSQLNLHYLLVEDISVELSDH